MRHRRLRRGHGVLAPLVMAVAVVSGLIPMRGEGASTDFELFTPAPVPEGGCVSESARMMGRTWTAGTYFQFEQDPVGMAGSVQEYDGMVYYRTQMHLLFAYNVLDRALVSVDFPFTVSADQDIAGGRQTEGYLNDLVLRSRVPLRRWGEFHLGVSALLGLNTGAAEKLGGTDGRFLQPGVLVLGEYDRPRWFVRANLGYWEREDTDLAEYDLEGLEIADRVLTRLAGGVRVNPDLIPFAELAGTHQVRDEEGAYDHNAWELYLGVQARLGDFTVSPGAAVGLTDAFGVPSWRFFCSIFYAVSESTFALGAGAGKPGQEELADLSVEVLDSATKEPVRKGKVSVRNKSDKFSRGRREAKLPPGKYKIAIDAEGYKPAGTRVSLPPGGKKSTAVNLEPILPKVIAKIVDYKTKHPIGRGRVYIQEGNVEGKFTKGKWKKTLSPGKFRIVFSAVGYHPKSKKVSLDLGEEESLEIKLVPKVKGVKVVVTEDEVYINEKIHFEPGSAKIKRESFALLDSVAEILMESPELKKFLIKGHCDSTGGFEFNVKLSHERAHAVRDYLVGKGIDPGRLESRGFGSSQPIADNATPEGQEENRRVEFEILEIGP